jgi:hypothetical protein
VIARARALRERLEARRQGSRAATWLLDAKPRSRCWSARRIPRSPDPERLRLLTEIAAARATLERCRAIGAANQFLADVALDALGLVRRARAGWR